MYAFSWNKLYSKLSLTKFDKKKYIKSFFWVSLAAVISFLSFRIFVSSIIINIRMISNFITGIGMIFGILFSGDNPNTESFIVFSVILGINLPWLIILWPKMDKKVLTFTFLFLFLQWLFNFVSIIFTKYVVIDAHVLFPSLFNDAYIRATFNCFIAGTFISVCKIFLYNGQATFGALDIIILYFKIHRKKNIVKLTDILNILIVLLGIIIIQSIRPVYDEATGLVNIGQTFIDGCARLLFTTIYIIAGKFLFEYYYPKSKIIYCKIIISNLDIIYNFLDTLTVNRTFTYTKVANNATNEKHHKYFCFLVLTDYEISQLSRYLKVHYPDTPVTIINTKSTALIGHFEDIHFQTK